MLEFMFDLWNNWLRVIIVSVGVELFIKMWKFLGNLSKKYIICI